MYASFGEIRHHRENIRQVFHETLSIFHDALLVIRVLFG